VAATTVTLIWNVQSCWLNFSSAEAFFGAEKLAFPHGVTRNLAQHGSRQAVNGAISLRS
jgi:hypothetical protein